MWNGGRLYGPLGLFCELYYIMPGILKQIDSFIEIIKKPVYLWMVLIPYFIYLVAFFGILYVDKVYLDTLKSFTQAIIAVILIIRFNPLKPKHELQDYDETIIFGSALILFTNAVLH